MDAQETRVTLIARLGDSADAGAWIEFLECYGELLGGFAARWRLQAADVDDTVQEVLVRLSTALPGFCYDPALGSFRSYLKTVATNVVRDRFRQMRSLGFEDGPIESLSTPGDVDAAWEEEWRRHHVRQAMKRIGKEFSTGNRCAFERYALRGEDVGTVARELGMSVAQVYQAKSRILRRLKDLIAGQIAEEDGA